MTKNPNLKKSRHPIQWNLMDISRVLSSHVLSVRNSTPQIPSYRFPFSTELHPSNLSLRKSRNSWRAVALGEKITGLKALFTGGGVGDASPKEEEAEKGYERQRSKRMQCNR
ncbi:hypothetical protein NPIL_165051 [Nephila pilipes]|uniref:Uncharacterized protein n=1 Tax=Nephila pilipes TaxID=299642 RepID=A0A8X6U3Q5_NEPPI|nr:hypothetical protein NPIL_165051 [Nephila pilipes]